MATTDPRLEPQALRLTTKGDLFVGTAAGGARLSAGSDGETLASDSSVTKGVKYVTKSVPVILLPAGSTAVNVPAGTPVGTIILLKA